MRGEVLRVAAALAGALLSSLLVVAWIAGPASGRAPPGVMDILMRVGLGAYQEELSAADPVDRPAVIERWRHVIRAPTRIERGQGSLDEQGMARRGLDDAYAYLPVGDEVAVVGPFPLPTPTWSQASLLVLVVSAIVLTAATMIVVPFARRIAVIERAFTRFRGGELSTRVPEDGPGSLATMASGFNHMAADLEARIRRQEELLQAVSHEYGTPLARLALHTEMLARRLPDQHAGRIEAMREDLAALSSLTGELVSLVELDADAPRLEVISDLAAIVRTAVRAEAGDDDRVSVDLDGDEEVAVSGRAVDVNRCIANLVRNARRYARNHVRVRIEQRGRFVAVLVDDDGPGIPLESRERVFEPFARLEQSRDRRTGGVGLGLAIARRCALQLRGSLSAEESPLGGARMSLVVPRNDGRPATTGPAAPQAQVAPCVSADCDADGLVRAMRDDERKGED